MAEKNVNNINNDLMVIWLDSNIEKSRNDLDTKALIRRMVRGNLLTFKDTDQCVNHIFEKLTTKRVIFIVSNAFGPTAVSVIHNLPQIQIIYVYCRTRTIAEEWSKPYPKVSNIFTDKQVLLRQIRDDVGAFDTDNDLPMSVFHLEEQQNSLQKLTEQSAKFMWYQAVLTVLPFMAKYCNSKDEMIAECRASYHNDEIERKKINEFVSNYAPKNAFWWYTYDSFIYRLLNKALRTQNIEIIFKFRFFINDLNNQIQQLYRQYLTKNHAKRLTVYRGQRMTITEIELLKGNINEIISMNSFLSATTIRAIAEIFADTSDQSDEATSLQSVLFIIDICNFDQETTPFAFIQNYSCCKDEEEVLFTIGAIFKVESVTQENRIWYVHLQLNRQQNQQNKDLSSYMLKQIGSDPSPSTLGWFLYRMSEFNKAERYIQLLLKQLPSNDIEVANANNLLGLIYKDLKRLPDSIKAYEKALEIYSQSSNPITSQVIAIHCNLGLAYLVLDDLRSADEQQSLAEEKLSKGPFRDNQLMRAVVATLRGKIQIEQGDYAHASDNFQTSLQRKKSKLPAEHPSIASSLNDLGVVQEKMQCYDNALNYFNQALTIRRRSLPQDHLDIAECLKNISRINQLRKEPELATKHKELASEIEMNDIRE